MFESKKSTQILSIVSFLSFFRVNEHILQVKNSSMIRWICTRKCHTWFRHSFEYYYFGLRKMWTQFASSGMFMLMFVVDQFRWNQCFTLRHTECYGFNYKCSHSSCISLDYLHVQIKSEAREKKKKKNEIENQIRQMYINGLFMRWY